VELEKLVQALSERNRELETDLNHITMKAKAAEEKARLANDAWYEQREATGKAWWNGAKWGHALGLKQKRMMVEKLYSIWVQHPHLRLGQMIGGNQVQ
jgi:hypothetical protein